jgi:16S rRNA U1498 N3-methylase RsmE
LWSAKNGPAQPDDELLMIADQHGVPLLNQLQGTTPDRPRAILVVIGPEGGLSPTEVAEARTRGAVGVSAGRHILRVETAAAALAATIRCYYAAGESAAPMSPAGLSAATPSSDGGSGSC